MFADMQVHWDLGTPLIMVVMLVVAIVVVAALFSQNSISSSRADLSKNALQPASLPRSPSQQQRRILAAPKTNPFKDPRERRAALRREGNPVEVLVSYSQSLAEPLAATVIDRSTGGLCLSVPHKAEVGKLLSVRAINAPDTFPWITVEIRHCRPTDDRWLVGCKFQRKLPWSELIHFG